MGDPLAVEIQEWEIHFVDDVAAELTLAVAAEEGTEVRTLRKISDEFLEPLGPSP
jgi:predicted ATP-grasp superfamily ATP-dependent carboligase